MAPYVKLVTRPTSIEGSKMARNIPGRSHDWSIREVFVSGDQGLMCIKIQVSSPSKMAKYCMDTKKAMELRNGQSIEGMDTVFTNGRTPSAKTRICASGDRLRSTLKSHCHHHLLYPGQPDSARSGIGTRLLYSHHLCFGKVHRSHVKFTQMKDLEMSLAVAEEFGRVKADLQRIH